MEQPSSISAPALIRKSATSENPPQQAKVRAVSWVSSVWAFIFAPGENKKVDETNYKRLVKEMLIVLNNDNHLYLLCFWGSFQGVDNLPKMQKNFSYSKFH